VRLPGEQLTCNQPCKVADSKVQSPSLEGRDYLSSCFVSPIGIKYEPLALVTPVGQLETAEEL